jgi:glycerol-3-phosphate dehydrogenase
MQDNALARGEILAQLRAQPEVSVLIIGGGINGIGTFRDLASQGVDVLLVDKADFCAGASAASSHMVHGGLRYLENGEFRLVREALAERNLLLQNAPHYVKPMPTTIPIFGWFSGFINAPLRFVRLSQKPSKRGAVIIKIGLTMYDLFARDRQGMPGHKFASKKAALQRRPALNPSIVCTATYYDAWMPYPERICLELILDAEAMSPQARALNYVKVVSGQGDTVTLCDDLSGESYEVRPKVVVNAAGPWIDFANRALQHQTQYIGGTKGSHLVLNHPELHAATGGHELFFENEDGRIVLVFALQDRVLVGTTDIRIDDPEQAICTEEEVDYMLRMLHRVFPGLQADRSHIVFRFSGVRPLPASEAGYTGQISRDHSIEVLEAGNGVNFPIYSLVGGKWTTFRAFAEQTTDQLLARLNKTRQTNTEHMPIGGGKDYPKTEDARQQWLKNIQAQTNLSTERLSLLLERYGTRAADIAAFICGGHDKPLKHHPDFSQREVVFVTLHEKVVHLDDFILRRSLLAMTGHLDRPLLEELAGLLAVALGWSEAQAHEEIERALQLLATRHGVTL